MINIVKGSIVKFKNPENRSQYGYYRVTSFRGGKVNLGAIFGKHIIFKSVDVELVIESESKWYEEWQQSDTYKCM